MSDKTVNKYEADWQIVRASVRIKNTLVEEKLQRVRNYFEDRRTYESFVRASNWAVGLLLGYKAAGNLKAIDTILVELEWYDGIDKESLLKENSNEVKDSVNFKKLSKYDFSSRYLLWKDLFKRTSQWVGAGYFHEDNMQFVEVLYSTFEKKEETDLIKKNFSYEKLHDLINCNSKRKNTHKFLF